MANGQQQDGQQQPSSQGVLSGIATSAQNFRQQVQQNRQKLQQAQQQPQQPNPPQPTQQPTLPYSNFDVDGARREGYSDDEILDHLTQQSKFDTPGALKEGYTKQEIINHLADAGQVTNDVGQAVIVPKQGESFADTLQRAVAYRKSLTPAQQQSSINAEVGTIPKKTAQTLGAAAGIGVAGPAALAAPGELASGAWNALNAGAARLIPYAPQIARGLKVGGQVVTGLAALKYILQGLLSANPNKVTQGVKHFPTE